MRQLLTSAVAGFMALASCAGAADAVSFERVMEVAVGADGQSGLADAASGGPVRFDGRDPCGKLSGLPCRHDSGQDKLRLQETEHGRQGER